MSKKGKRPGKRSGGGPWYGDFRERLRFEGDARKVYPGLRGITAHGRGGFKLVVDVEVPHYPPRRVTIVFDRTRTQVPRVFADGPTRSKHRYSGGALCMWFPNDPPEKRWVLADGLLALIGHAVEHLFREAWWRETDEWLGPEAPHGLPAESKAAPRDDRDREDRS